MISVRSTAIGVEIIALRRLLKSPVQADEYAKTGRQPVPGRSGEREALQVAQQVAQQVAINGHARDDHKVSSEVSGMTRRIPGARAQLIGAGAAAGVLMLAACSGGGHATNASPTPSRSPAESPAPLTAGTLASLLLPVPPGDTERATTFASPDGTMTLAQYMHGLYPSAPSERTLLTGRGFEGAAVRTFSTSRGEQAVVVLTLFSAQQGALSETRGTAAARVSALAADMPNAFVVLSLTNGNGYEVSSLDSYGNTSTYVYGCMGDVAVNMDFYAPRRLDRTEVLALINAQALRLQEAQGLPSPS